jgi:enhancer of mRNA-decapping protein 4
MKTVLVPAFESATRQMFLQVASSLEKGLATQQPTDSMEGLTAKLDEMARAMESLSLEVAQLRSAVASSQGVRPASPFGATSRAVPPPDSKQATRDGIIALLQKQDYEAAFTKALTASTVDMAVFCCKNSSVSDVLGGSSPALTQPILLCLMQQLGAVLVSSKDDELQMILVWLQEIGLTLDPTYHLINTHVPGVLQQLVASIDTKMAEGDPKLRRPLQMLLQVIRGMQR